MARVLGVFVMVMALATMAGAEETKTAPAAGETVPPAEEAVEEVEAELPPHLEGPKLVELGSNIELDLPEGFILLERAEARKLLEQGGDSAENVLAVVGKPDANWLIVIEFDDIGYVNDKDADQLDANELFQQYVEGTKQQNARRKALGVPELFLDGWSEMPTYKRAEHHLVWGLKGHSSEGPVINFFTRILGRHGFLSVNLIDSPDTIEQAKVDSAPVLAATRFKSGARYEDFREGDKDSGLGLRALVLGGAGVGVAKAAKAGILVKILLVFKKGFIVILLAIGGFIKWLLGRKKKDDDAPPSDDTNVPPPESDPPATPPAG